MPDQPDIGVLGHVVLRVMLPHRRPERLGRGEVLRRGEALVPEHQREVLGERPVQRLTGLAVHRPAEVDAGDFRPERRMQRRNGEIGHGGLPKNIP